MAFLPFGLPQQYYCLCGVTTDYYNNNKKNPVMDYKYYKLTVMYSK